MAPSSVHPRKSQRELQISCVGCSSNLLESSYYAQIKKEEKKESDDCTHILCIKCFGNAHADRSVGLKLKCPSASYDRSSRDCAIVQCDDDGRQPATKRRTNLPVRVKNDMKNHPTLYYSNQSRHIRSEHALLRVSQLQPQHQQTKEALLVA